MFFLLQFPIYSLDLYPFIIPLITNFNIIIHIHKLSMTTIKLTNFLSVMINYKLKFYKRISINSSHLISLVNKSNKKQRIQKGSGRSRIGSLKSSAHKGGGVIFGPRPRFINLKINTKEWAHIYKSLMINKRSNILWFFINKISWHAKNKNFIKILAYHLGISSRNRIRFIIIDRYITCKQASWPRVTSTINLLDFLNTKYIIYLI